METRHLNSQEKAIYREAAEAVRAGVDAAEFTSRFFGQDGRLALHGKTLEERRRIVASPLYGRLHELLASIRSVELERFENAINGLSGRLTIQVPRSLHAALKEEAVQEGVSLAELIRLKLGIPYHMTVRALTATRPTRKPVNQSKGGRLRLDRSTTRAVPLSDLA